MDLPKSDIPVWWFHPLTVYFIDNVLNGDKNTNQLNVIRIQIYFSNKGAILHEGHFYFWYIFVLILMDFSIILNVGF